MNKYLSVTGDCNDGDYVNDFEPITNQTEEYIRRIAPIIKANQGDVERIIKDPCFREIALEGEEINSMFNEDDLVNDAIYGILPYAPDGLEVHTIESIKIYKIESIEDLY